MIKQRNIFLDVIKGFTIFLVVLGHCIQYGTGQYINDVFYEDFLYKSIYSFHMPLFMLVSGYLFYYTLNKYEWIDVCKTRISKLLVPIFSWNILFCIFQYIEVIIRNQEQYSLLYYVKYCFVELWFLWAVFFCGLGVVFIKRFCKDKIIVYLLLFIICLLLPRRFNLHVYTYMFPFFVIGYWTNKYKLLKSWEGINNINKYLLFMFLSVGFIGMLLHFSRVHYVYTSGVCILKFNENGLYIDWAQLNIDIFRYLIGLIGSFLTCIFIKNLISTNDKQNVLTKTFSMLGKKTLGIYAISSFINVHVLNNLVERESYNYFISVSTETILILLFTYYVLKLMEKSSLLRTTFLGSR